MASRTFVLSNSVDPSSATWNASARYQPRNETNESAPSFDHTGLPCALTSPYKLVSLRTVPSGREANTSTCGQSSINTFPLLSRVRSYDWPVSATYIDQR